jgi:hypothetical protein
VFGRFRASRSADHRSFIEFTDDDSDDDSDHDPDPDESIDGGRVARSHTDADIDTDGHADIARDCIGIPRAFRVPVTEANTNTHDLADPNGFAEPGRRVADISV